MDLKVPSQWIERTIFGKPSDLINLHKFMMIMMHARRGVSFCCNCNIWDLRIEAKFGENLLSIEQQGVLWQPVWRLLYLGLLFWKNYFEDEE